MAPESRGRLMQEVGRVSQESFRRSQESFASRSQESFARPTQESFFGGSDATHPASPQRAALSPEWPGRINALRQRGNYVAPGTSGSAAASSQCSFGDTRPPTADELELRERQERDLWVESLWQRLDRDESGSITRDELECESFYEVVRAGVAPDKSHTGGASYERAELNMKAAINFAMRKADASHHGFLSFEEFRSLLFSLRDPKSNTCDLAFALFDLDQSHSIDKKEFRELCRFFLGHNVIEKDFKEQWDLLTKGAENDEQASKRQYVRWLKATQHPVFRQYAPAQASEAEAGAPKRKRRPSGQPRTLDPADRPRWNKRFNEGPNPGHLNDARPIGTRSYFAKSQSLPQLKRFYEMYSDHFKGHMAALDMPEPPRPTAALHPKSLSSEGGTPLSLPGRHCPDGTMRDHATKRVTMWEDHWSPPLRMKSRFRPGDLPLSPRATFGEINDRHSQWAAATFTSGFGRGRFNGGSKSSTVQSSSKSDRMQRRESLQHIQPARVTSLEAEPW